MSEAPTLPGWQHVYSGKVRDLYVPLPGGDFDPARHVLVVASDRISAFDHILPTLIPDKGRVLTALTLWWFEKLAHLGPNHLVSLDVPEAVAGRAMVCQQLHMLPVECVVRGYLTGTGLKDYQRTGEVCGVKLPEGLVEASPLPEPIFTPAAKAELGEHDENVSFRKVCAMVGEETAAALRDQSLAIYSAARELAAARGIILADTKFEFGQVEDQPGAVQPSPALVLADEVLTPDSSRFWSAEEWEEGKPTPSYDKQFVRDWLKSPESNWDSASGQTPPELPAEVVEATRQRYLEAYQKLTGQSLEW
ncbi:phosphoribosylaminoimidazolesuccinocarboxamide synthase [Boudabousia liubingyangii]|uniref:Phosphoribosylaminoimidazole-succinocarboxamide synthase n=1 Tax=Boudabousia liubingyangii TaxID=1921764 RepID=A0A1Q5PK48_9ACTO|nr:phosphoribosylaminoimidazolesuccinocarboxamide synthase [Boudabousia liubingyangii]OKL46593.1 phosphoribosylaminoimidazolesuccinocarboxamide synthase [Boudabousia liubingyangii]OKL46821.1 phosphoribosylaminoimidazolesuccinocarboxamide synthase [Boudabousia liubingyangii]